MVTNQGTLKLEGYQNEMADPHFAASSLQHIIKMGYSNAILSDGIKSNGLRKDPNNMGHLSNQ